MYNASKLNTYQNTANLLNGASSYREVMLPVSEVAQQFSELLNAVKISGVVRHAPISEETSEPTEKKSKGGKKSKEE